VAELNDDDAHEEVEALSAGAKQLISRAMAEDEPPEGAQDESWGMVVSRVDDVRAEPAVVDAAPRAPQPSRWIGAGVLALSILSVVALGVWVVMSGPPPEPDMPAKAPPAKADAKTNDTRTSDAKTSDAKKSDAKAKTDDAKMPAVDPAQLLDDAEAALTRKDAARALDLLEQHAELAPLDAPRRLALRIRTLCALDRIDDAKSEAAAFLSTHGASSWAADVRASCGARTTNPR
jgi:hypothetical protein